MRNTDIKKSKQTEKDIQTIQNIARKIVNRYQTVAEMRAIESVIYHAVSFGACMPLIDLFCKEAEE